MGAIVREDVQREPYRIFTPTAITHYHIFTKSTQATK